MRRVMPPWSADPTIGTKFRNDRSLTAEEIRSALDKHHGVREKVWRELGLPNRYVLQRLMKRYGLHSET